MTKKVRDLLSLSEEMLSADVMLPNLVAMAADLISSAPKADVQSTKLVILETLNDFVNGCTHLDQDVHYESVVQSVAMILQTSTTLKHI